MKAMEHAAESSAGVCRPIAVRAYPVILKEERSDFQPAVAGATRGTKQRGPWVHRWPRLALVFDCETRIDASQRLTVGFAVVLRSDWRCGEHEVAGIVCFADEAALSRPERLTVEAWLAEPLAEVLTRIDHRETRVRLPEDLAVEYQPVEAFRETFYTLGFGGKAAVVGFNLGFDLSRLAVRATATKDKQGFVFTLINHEDSRGRKGTKVKHPRVRVVPIDGRRNLVQFTGTKPRYDGRFVDLKTLGDALTGRKHSLASACQTFGAGTKAEHEHDGRVTRELLDYALTDALVTAELYVAQVGEHRRHPIAKAPNEVYSEATIGKAYLEAMGLRLPELVVDPGLDLPRRGVEAALAKARPPAGPGDRISAVLGLATTTYFGGRTECRIRKTVVPVDYWDFASMYPTVNTLMDLWRPLTAERIRAVDATEEVQHFLDEVNPDDLFDPETWRGLPAIVEVLPEEDVLPARTRFGDETYSVYGIGVNPVTSPRPLWYTLADCLAAKLRTGKAARVLRAIRFVPEGRQTLKWVQLRGQVVIDPNADDFFRQAIVERRKVKRAETPYGTLSADERDRLQQFLKILINATSYGIYMEMNRKKGKTARVRVHGLTMIEREIDGPEELGRYCLPPLATLITGGARLMLALAEHEVRRRGGHYALMDTDSIAIVATQLGGPVPCENGDLRLPNGRKAIRALSWREVEEIRDRFRSLNPYGDGESILELEQENYAPCGLPGHEPCCVCTQARSQLYAYAVASKRYALVNLGPGGEVALRGIRDAEDVEDGLRELKVGDEASVRKYSEHGLGAYEAPRDPSTGKPVGRWERDVWEYLVGRALGQPVELAEWAHQTALTQVRISTPEQLRWFRAYNSTVNGEAKPYEDAVKPFNFLGHAIPKPLTALRPDSDPGRFCLVAPARERRRFVNRHEPDGPVYVAGIDFTPKTYADLIQVYDLHSERKFAGSDARPCQPGTRGLLHDLPVLVAGIKHVGKEGNELEAHRAGLVTEAERQLEYHDSFYDDLAHVLRAMGAAEIARETGYDRSMVRRLKRGECRPSAERLPNVLAIAASHARMKLSHLAPRLVDDDCQAVALYGGMLATEREALLGTSAIDRPGVSLCRGDSAAKTTAHQSQGHLRYSRAARDQ
ncbi:MAG: hypothetical protein M3R02_06830 [Chloroflexota bacterium]|nr:hypothetical protein [Chloroflexota bacterium]